MDTVHSLGGEGRRPPPWVGKDATHPLTPGAPLVPNAVLSGAPGADVGTLGRWGRWGGVAQPTLGGACLLQGQQGAGVQWVVGRWSVEVEAVWMGDAGSIHFLDAQKVWEVRLAGMDVCVGTKGTPGFCS